MPIVLLLLPLTAGDATLANAVEAVSDAAPAHPIVGTLGEAPEAIDRRPAVAISIRGTRSTMEEARIREMLESTYRIVPEGEAATTVTVDLQGTLLTVEVRDGGSVVSRREMSTTELQLDLMVWLVVRDAFLRVESSHSAPALSPTRPATPPEAPVASAVAAVPALAQPWLRAGVTAGASSGALAFPEVGAHAFASFLLGATAVLAVSFDLDAGYRYQASDRVDVHALPLGASLGVALLPFAEPGASVALHLRAEAAGKLASPAVEAGKPQPARGNAVLMETSLGPVVRATLPLDAASSVRLVLELGAAGKLSRQSYVFADGSVDETPYRAHVAAGVEVAWD